MKVYCLFANVLAGDGYGSEDLFFGVFSTKEEAEQCMKENNLEDELGLVVSVNDIFVIDYELDKLYL